LQVYNLRGQRIRTIEAGKAIAGRREIIWDGKGDGGGRMASGVYVVRMRVEDVVQTRKMMLVR
jgi:flagellar hook assembly protein FlgD